MSKLQAIICDLDGTLAIKGDRHFSDYNKVGEDNICPSVKEVLDKFTSTHHVLLVSGRENKDYCRSLTEFWLKVYEVPYHDLFMRSFGDFRSDDIVKKEIYDTYIKPFYNVSFVLDDRSKVVKMWRSQGLVCFQVQEGDF